MADPYLNEVRLGQPLKDNIREIMHDVADTFDVRGATRHRPVPHITLFGPYNTNQGLTAKRYTQGVLSRYDVVPYKIAGFDHFRNDVIYAKVVPSDELRELRRKLSRALRPISYNYQDHDTDRYYEFHITIAFKNIQSQFDEIWRYVNEQYDLECTAYAKRVTALRKRDMMWEWDLPHGTELRSQEATSRAAWKQTEEALEALLEENQNSEPVYREPGRIERLMGKIAAKTPFSD